MLLDHPIAGATAIHTEFGAIFVSLELSVSTWIVTSLSPGNGEKMSQHGLPGGELAGLRALFAELKRKARERTELDYPIIAIQEAGLDGFWIHRALRQEGIQSYVVDAASVATSRRRHRAKTDKIDGKTLLRALLAFLRGEPRVCAMVTAPSPEEEDRRRLCRERQALLGERIVHTNRIKGLLFAQGISDYAPLRRDRRKRLEGLQTGDGRSLPVNLKAEISRELDRLELLLDQIKAVEAAQEAMLVAACQTANEGEPGSRTMRQSHAARWQCCLRSKGSARMRPPFCGRKGCPGRSPTAVRSRPMRALPRRLGAAGRSCASKACPRPAIRGCAR